MRAFQVLSQFGLENLTQVEIAEPNLEPNSVRVQISNAALNYRDLLMARGLYNPKLKLPYTPCSDGVGTIIEVGSEVTTLKPGDRVSPGFSTKWLSGKPPLDVFKGTLGGPLDGTLAEQICLPVESVVKMPEYLSDAEAASLPCAGLTAYNSIITFGKIQAGDTVLVLGTGGVSVFALQIAKARGAMVIATTGTDEKIPLLKEHGADYIINHDKTPDWHKSVREITDGLGVDLVVEVGGADTLPKSIKAVRHGGHISLIGVLAGNSKDLNLLPILMRNIRIQGVLVGSIENFIAMNSFFAENRIKPVISDSFSFEDSAKAFLHLKNRSHFGKVSIQVC